MKAKKFISWNLPSWKQEWGYKEGRQSSWERKNSGSEPISELAPESPTLPSVYLQSQDLSPHPNIYPRTPSEAPDHEEEWRGMHTWFVPAHGDGGPGSPEVLLLFRVWHTQSHHVEEKIYTLIFRRLLICCTSTSRGCDVFWQMLLTGDTYQTSRLIIRRILAYSLS